ncbi:hypothetical protein NX801_17165 [Streptomyces sp. LP05-1]|uniref:MHYT domain-containing protein n=1 Tax=Streptomyces pyxinae TaxID=2970734 RepID=A0ABT2CIX5_9ACTN|nr:MHYT domain-containing protein [Streptomyces sp. LP05-1]MCS0637364.1 hypothetical protein [Streptomyces sp. LP05-1]
MRGAVGTVEGFDYGLVTPVAAQLIAWFGGALGLRCTTRALRTEGPARLGRLALAAVALGSGVWAVYVVAMMGFSVAETPVGYDRRLAVAGCAVAVAMAGLGVFVVGHRGATALALVTGGTLTGLGIATVHYLGMAGVRLQGRLEYQTSTVVLSVLVAVVAATGALWLAVAARGFWPGLGAGLIMGVAITGMHYTGMAALRVRLSAADPVADPGGLPAVCSLAPLLTGPVVLLLAAGAAVLFDPRPAPDDRASPPSPSPPRARRSPSVPARDR